MDLTFIELMQQLWGDYFSEAAYEMLYLFLDSEGIESEVPLSDLPVKHLQKLLEGTSESRHYQTSEGLYFRWAGLNQLLAHSVRSIDSSIRKAAIMLMEETPCISCGGARINDLARHVTIKNKGIQDLCSLPINEALHFLKKLTFSTEERHLLEEVMSQLEKRLAFMCEVGLDYLSLNRMAPTLSGGEAQRIRLARQLGSGLTGSMYVLDEPTIGLHPKDNERLNKALLKLKNLGNTLLLVEHDPLTISIADTLLDFGPMAGEKGGHIVARGTLSQIKKNPKSSTGKYLSGKLKVSVPEKRRTPTKTFLTIKNASLNNLKSIEVKIPCGLLTLVTGVSGSGKSTLIHQILSPAVEKGLLSGEDTSYFPLCQGAGHTEFRHHHFH